MQDIVPELREAVENSFTESVKKNEKIQKILERVQAGKATYEDADEYAAEIGEALANAFREHISSDILPDGKMYYNIASRLVPGPCRLAQAAINNVTGQIQRDMNEKAGLSIKPQIPRYNEDREKGLIEYMCGADRYDDVSKSATADIVNFIQSMVTDAVKANAEFQWRAGLSPVIRRTVNGGCCAWCAKLAGVYPYEDVRATGSDVYRRHRDCRCKVTFDPGDGTRQDVHTKRWESQNPNQTAKKADNEEQRVHSYKSKGKDITKRYLQDATPGRGTVDIEDGFKVEERTDEVMTATLLHRILGGDIILKAEKHGQKNPDYEWLGALWDLKTTTTAKAANSAIKSGMKQIRSNPGGIILNYGERKIDMDELLEVIDKRMGWYPDECADIIIISKNKLRMVLRY